MADDGGEVEIIDCSTDGTCDEDDGGGSESILIHKSLSEETIDALQQLAIGKKPEKKDTAYYKILSSFNFDCFSQLFTILTQCRIVWNSWFCL